MRRGASIMPNHRKIHFLILISPTWTRVCISSVSSFRVSATILRNAILKQRLHFSSQSLENLWKFWKRFLDFLHVRTRKDKFAGMAHFALSRRILWNIMEIWTMILFRFISFVWKIQCWYVNKYYIAIVIIIFVLLSYLIYIRRR